MSLSRARCANHTDRLASGICPSCSRPYCRECLTEHDGRLTCAACLKRGTLSVRAGGAWKAKVAAPAMLIASLLASWFFFYAVGSTLELMSAPAARTSQ
jgi:hypothetical protein